MKAETSLIEIECLLVDYKNNIELFSKAIRKRNIRVKKLLKNLQIIIICILFSINSYSQEAKYVAYNTLFNGCVGGIGSIINKNSNQKFSKAFINGFYKGSVGGAVIYGSRKLVNQISLRHNYWYGLAGKITNSVGTSIVNNAYFNEKIFSKYYINFGFIRYKTDFKKHQFTINPVTFGMFSYFLINSDYSFNGINSIKTGTLSFNFNDENMDYQGITYNNIIITHSKDLLPFNSPRANLFSVENSVSHELIHSFQYEEHYFLNDILNNYKFIKKLKYVSIDIPFNGITYLINRDFFENEAEFFSLNPY